MIQCDTIVLMNHTLQRKGDRMTVEEAIRRHKAAVRRVGKGHAYICDPVAVKIYTAHYRKVQGQILTDEEQETLRRAGA